MQSQEKPLNLSPPKYVTAALRFFEWVYPPMAVKMAKKFFFTPFKFPRPERELKTAEQAQRQELMIGKKRITVYTWGKGDKKILMVHGWAGRATQFFKIKNYLLSRGFQVVAFDAPAHGENTDVEQTHMLEFVESIERVNMTFGPFYGAVGHSLGGLAIINAYNKGFKVEKLAVIAAPCSIANVIRDFTRRIGAGERTEKGLIAHLIANYEVPLEHYSGQEQAPTVKAKGLIVHDIHDHDVSVEESRMLHKAWKGSMLHVTKRLGHRRILLDKDAVVKVADFFGKRKPGRPPRKSTNRPQRRPNTQAKEQGDATKSTGKSSRPSTVSNSNQSETKQASKRPSRKPAEKSAPKQSGGPRSSNKQRPNPAQTEKKQDANQASKPNGDTPSSTASNSKSNATRRKTSGNATRKSTSGAKNAQDDAKKTPPPRKKSSSASASKRSSKSSEGGNATKRDTNKPSSSNKDKQS